MPRKPGMTVFEMILDLFTTFFGAIFRGLGRMLGGAIIAGVIGAFGGGAMALYNGFPFFPWLIGGFVACAILALVLMVFVANDL